MYNVRILNIKTSRPLSTRRRSMIVSVEQSDSKEVLHIAGRDPEGKQHTVFDGVAVELPFIQDARGFGGTKRKFAEVET
jgi:hypothetical protein